MVNKKLSKGIKFVVGIDEVGRGPLAGPVAIGAFKMPVDFQVKNFGLNQSKGLVDRTSFKKLVLGKIKDSKKLSPEKREEIFDRLKKLKNINGEVRHGELDYSVCYESAKRIDKIGLSRAIKNCIESGFKKLKVKPAECLVLLNGGLKAPAQFKNQKTIIRGDEKERAIAFASIVAKVSRDALMRNFAKKYPKYGFEIHKGYGTEMHRKLIKKFSLCSIHRRSFCRNLR